MLLKENKFSFRPFAAARVIDSHAHLNFNAYKNDVDEVIKRSLENEVWMINVGSQYNTSKRAVEVAEKYEKGVWAAIGLHPIHVQDGFDPEKYKKIAESKKVVAIGEIGLDYKSEYAPFKEKQKSVFYQQLELAQKLELPVIFHCRMAHDDLIQLLEKYNKGLKGVVHCFTGNWLQAQKYLEMGLYLGFNGIIFKLNLDEIIKKTPLDKILIETDCPYLTPPLPAEVLTKAGPMKDRNEPIYVRYVVEKIAKIKNLSAKRTAFSSSPSFSLRENSVFEEVAEKTTQNAKNLFNL